MASGLSQQLNQQHDESEIQFWLEVKAACDYTFGLIQTSLLLLGLCSALIPKLTFPLCVCSVKGVASNDMLSEPGRLRIRWICLLDHPTNDQ